MFSTPTKLLLFIGYDGSNKFAPIASLHQTAHNIDCNLLDFSKRKWREITKTDCTYTNATVSILLLHRINKSDLQNVQKKLLNDVECIHRMAFI